MLGDQGVRLVTVTGPAGVGKSRVAYAVAEAMTQDLSCRVVRVDLAPLAHPSLIGDAIAAAAGASHRSRTGPALDAAAAALKEERALLVLDNFEHLEPAAGDVATLLDGAPAAARVAVPPPAMIARWEDAVGLDAPGARDLPSRQRTLRRAFDWGYDLLDHEERALLPRLAAFPGGFDTLAVEAACRGDDGVLAALGVEPIPTLARVVDRSLVSRDSGPAAEPRYSQLMTVRGYLREHLARDGEEEAADLLMANACAALARQDAQFLGAGRSREELDRLERELNNLRAGLDVFLRAAPRGGRSTSRWTSTASGRPAMSARAASPWSGRSARLTCRRARAPPCRPRPAPGIEVWTNRCQAGAEGIHGGERAEPAGVAIGGGGLVDAAGFRNRRISTYAANGTWLRAFGKHVNRLLPGSFKLCVRREFCEPGEDGDGAGALRGPEWLAIDATGNVYVSEFGSRVSVFSAQGTFLLAFGKDVVPATLRRGWRCARRAASWRSTESAPASSTGPAGSRPTGAGMSTLARP